MSNVDIDDTIVAIASAEGSGLRGIVRLTGPLAITAAQRTFDDLQIGNEPQQVEAWVSLGDDGHAQRLEGQLMVWPDERSYTRQPSAEFHTVGSRPLLDMVMELSLIHI